MTEGVPSSAQGADTSSGRLADLVRAQRAMVLVRWIGTPWALAQVLFYENPYPPGLEMLGIALVGLLATGNVVIALVGRGEGRDKLAPMLGIGGLALDVFVIGAFVWLYTFDPASALWAILFILPLEGAILFGLNGALGAWAAAMLLYTAREIWGSARYDYPLLWNSVSFRMGVGLIIALVAGLMARDLMRQREQLATLVEELRRVDALRSGLISTLAHDVRGPLSSVRGVLRTLLARAGSLPEETVVELQQMADRQAERIERLASDLLDLARLEQGRLEMAMEDVRVDDAVAAALSYVDEGAAFTTKIDSSVAVRADPQRLQQVLVNLCANAVKHGAPPFAIEADGIGHAVRIAVSDAGSGVAEEFRPSLFDAFASGGAGSIGLGLAIVRELVGAHGGTVAYEPNKPGGARFVVTLPAAGDGSPRVAPGVGRTPPADAVTAKR